MNEYLYDDIRHWVMKYCLREKGKWWATTVFRNKEVDELFAKEMARIMEGGDLPNMHLLVPYRHKIHTMLVTSKLRKSHW